jgi:hypothetical protein
MRVCKKCFVSQPLEEFEIYNREKGHRRGKCRTCRKADNEAYFQGPVVTVMEGATRHCKKCGEEKPLDQFEVVNPNRGWRRWECRDCTKRRVEAWTEQSKDHVREYASADYAANREDRIRQATEWNREHPERRRKTALAHYYKMQHQAIMAYGGYRCACCGETEPLFLSLDHVNNDGKAHRMKLGTLGGTKLYKWLRENEWPEGFQVLCMNCNQGRHRNGGTCPHKDPRKV